MSSIDVDPDEALLQRALSRALTLPGYFEPGATYTEESARKLVISWKQARRWCAETGHTPITIAPWTSETLGIYVIDLLKRGLSAGAVGNAVSAVRTQHRILGHPVPDSLPTWQVRQIAEQTRRERGAVMTRDTLVKLWVFVPPVPWKGIRDRCLYSMIWGSGLSVARTLAINIEDVRITRARMAVRSQKDSIVVAHDHRAGMVCPVEAASAWIAALAGQPDPAATSGALFRPATRQGIDGTAGFVPPGRPAREHRLSPQTVKVQWTQLIKDAQIGKYSLADLRHAGITDRRVG